MILISKEEQKRIIGGDYYVRITRNGTYHQMITSFSMEDAMRIYTTYYAPQGYRIVETGQL